MKIFQIVISIFIVSKAIPIEFSLFMTDVIQNLYPLSVTCDSGVYTHADNDLWVRLLRDIGADLDN